MLRGGPAPHGTALRIREGRLSGGLFHVTPSLRCRLLAPLRHADCIKECPLSGVTRKTFAYAEFFSV